MFFISLICVQPLLNTHNYLSSILYGDIFSLFKEVVNFYGMSLGNLDVLPVYREYIHSFLLSLKCFILGIKARSKRENRYLCI